MSSSVKIIKSIPSHIKRSILIIFITLSGVYLFLLIQYIPGREDWDLFINKSPLISWDIVNARYFTRFLHFFIFDGQFGLPVFARLFDFFILAISSAMLCTYWRLQKSTIMYSLVGLVFVLQPYFLNWFYYGYGEIYSILPFFVICGFFLCEKAYNIKSWYRIVIFILSILCFWFVLGTYIVIANSIGIIFLGRCLIDFVNNKNKLRSLILSKYLQCTSIVGGMFLHFIVILLLKWQGILCSNCYNLVTLELSDVPARISVILKTMLAYLYDYSIPFFPRIFTLIFTFLLVCVIGTTVFDALCDPACYKWEKKFLNVIIIIFLFFVTFAASFVTNVISKNTTFFQPHADFFGIAVFHIFVLVSLYNVRKVIIKNITFLACVGLICICMVQNFYAQKIWYFGFEAEKQEWMRIINRIETTPDFQGNKSYKVLILGATKAYRPLFYRGGHGKQNQGFGLLEFPYMPGWGAANISVLDHYTCYVQEGKWVQIHKSADGDFAARFRESLVFMKDELISSKPWPALSSIHIKDDIILVVLSNKDLEEAKNIINS